VLALKALKLTDSFMDLYRNNGLTGEKLREKKLSWVDIFEEIPVCTPIFSIQVIWM
jgi:translation initiation factor 3 subunit H